jgi:hypothetical protein
VSHHDEALRRFNLTFAIGLLTLLLLGLFPARCTAQPAGMTALHEVPVTEKGGKLLPSERHLLNVLEAKGLPTPDSIVVKVGPEDKDVHGYVDRREAPHTVQLMPERREHPNADDRERFPYLYGRQDASRTQPVAAHVLVHEIGHIISADLDPELGRPALGVLSISYETQAEIIGLVLGKAAFGWSHKDLGFPSVIDGYPATKDKNTKALARRYCTIINSTYDTNLECTP